METKDAVIVTLTIVVVAFALVVTFNFLAMPKLKSGYTEIEGFLELRPYPKICMHIFNVSLISS